MSRGLVVAIVVIITLIYDSQGLRSNLLGYTRSHRVSVLTHRFAPRDSVEQELTSLVSIPNKAAGSYRSNSCNEIMSNNPMNDEKETLESNEGNNNDEFDEVESISSVASFIAKAGLVGLFTGLSVALFKSSLALTSSLFYEKIADILPKPSFYWPLGLYPVMGACIVSLITYFRGNSVRNGIDSIARSIDAPSTPPSINSTEGYNRDNTMNPNVFDPVNQLYRLLAAVATLGSGCSLGPEGSAVEIGASFGRIINGISPKEKHHLFLAGTAAGVAAGFNAPISGVFFAIECGNRYLSKNTVKLDEEAPDGPRADIAAIVLAASVADVVVNLLLHSSETLTVQGNLYGMASPVFELSLYAGLGLISGLISVIFTKLREIFTELFNGESWGNKLPFYRIPSHLRPLLGGLLCGIVAVYYPQTVFVGYATLDQLLAGKIILPFALVTQLLGLKILLSSFSLGSGLIGGIFAPSLFFGATAGTAYHAIITNIVATIHSFIATSPLVTPDQVPALFQFFSIASAPAYATVGAAATLGALFRAPLTSSMLMFELTQNHDIVLPVLVSTGLGGLFAEIISRSRKLWG